MSFGIVDGDVSLKKRTGEELGTTSDPVRIDPTGTTQQPVSQGDPSALINPWPNRMVDGAGNPASISEDVGVFRQEIAGKVTVVGASPPPDTNGFVVVADNPLSVGTHNTSLVIPSGETFHLQSIICGSEDPTKGGRVEIIYDNGSEHLIQRLFMSGFTLEINFPDIVVARDGTALVGNGSHEIIVRRIKFAGGNVDIDAVVRGYTI